MITVFDDDVNVYTPTLMAYGTVWNWLSAIAIISMFSSEIGLGIERASRHGWLMEPVVYTKEAFELKTYIEEAFEQKTHTKEAFELKTYTGE